MFVIYDRALDRSDVMPFDCGALTTALFSVAPLRGLGTVIHSRGIMQAPVVCEHVCIPDHQAIMKSVALGWPDGSFPANASFPSGAVEEATVFLSFDA